MTSLVAMKCISRRHFVRTDAAGVALPYLIPASVLGADAPTRKITIGFIGVGDHGLNWNLDRHAYGVIMTCVPGNPSIKFIGTDRWVGNRGWCGEVEASSPGILKSALLLNQPHPVKLGL